MSTPTDDEVDEAIDRACTELKAKLGPAREQRILDLLLALRAKFASEDLAIKALSIYNRDRYSVRSAIKALECACGTDDPEVLYEVVASGIGERAPDALQRLLGEYLTYPYLLGGDEAEIVPSFVADIAAAAGCT
jgi:hypothetical protein